MKRARFVVAGRVQGVGFRMAACREATRLQLVGFVRNQPDGEVAGEVQGEVAPLAAFRDWLTRGPLLARVDRVQWEEVAACSGDGSFTVLR